MLVLHTGMNQGINIDLGKFFGRAFLKKKKKKNLIEENLHSIEVKLITLPISAAIKGECRSTLLVVMIIMLNHV